MRSINNFVDQTPSRQELDEAEQILQQKHRQFAMMEKSDDDSYGEENHEPFDGNKKRGVANKPQMQPKNVRGKNLRDFQQIDSNEQKH